MSLNISFLLLGSTTPCSFIIMYLANILLAPGVAQDPAVSKGSQSWRWGSDAQASMVGASGWAAGTSWAPGVVREEDTGRTGRKGRGAHLTPGFGQSSQMKGPPRNLGRRVDGWMLAGGRAEKGARDGCEADRGR